jgi:acyl dehydratase
VADDQVVLEDLTPEMKAVIGTPGPATRYEVTTLGIRTFARSIGYTNPLYYDREAARAKGYPDLVAPPGYYGMPVYDPNRPADRGLTFENPFKRNLNGGTEVEQLERVFAGDELESVTTTTSMDLREGRLGQMLIRVQETVYTRVADGKVVGKIRGTGISY